MEENEGKKALTEQERRGGNKHKERYCKKGEEMKSIGKLKK